MTAVRLGRTVLTAEAAVGAPMTVELPQRTCIQPGSGSGLHIFYYSFYDASLDSNPLAQFKRPTAVHAVLHRWCCAQQLWMRYLLPYRNLRVVIATGYLTPASPGTREFMGPLALVAKCQH